jgi:hypothetical protein
VGWPVEPVQKCEQLRPIQFELAMRRSAISQIQVYEALIWDSSVLRYGLEVAYGFLIKANGNLFFQLGGVRIFSRSSKVIFFSHIAPFRGRTSILEDLLCVPK